MPKVSIITPLFNGAGFIGQAIRSVLDQTFKDWEMIIVDDCSTDHPEKVINPFLLSDARISYPRLERNQGAAAARNLAIARAQGAFIAFLDGDDTWEPAKLERQITLMENEGWAFSFTSYAVMDRDGKLSGKVVHAPGKLDYRHYLRNTAIGCLTVVIDRRQTGSFTMPLIRTSQDMALWLELMKRGFTAYGIDEVLASYRVVNTSNTANKWKAAAGVWQVYREIEKLPLLPSLWNFAGYAFHAVLKRL